MLVLWACTIVVVVSVNVYEFTLPCESMRDAYGSSSITYWMNVGLKGNGGYVDNMEYCAQLDSIYGLDKKEAFSRQYLRDNLQEFVNLEHIVAKLRYNFANGGLGASDFMRNTHRRNFFFECISTDGAYYWYYSMLNTSYFFFLLAMIFIASLKSAFRSRGELQAGDCVPLLVVFGIMLYVMLFEANNRQLYNQLPWIILGSLAGIRSVVSALKFPAGRSHLI